MRVYSGNNSATSYSFPFNLTNQYNKVISNITLRVAARKGESISEWHSETRDVIYPGCPITPICDTLGENISVTKNNYYKTCIKQSNNCYNWSEEKACPDGLVYNSELGICYSGLGSSCSGSDNNGNSLFCVDGLQVPFGAYNRTGQSCGNNHQTCVACNEGLEWNSDAGECIDPNCNQNCTTLGGTCLNETFGDPINNISENASLNCCTSKKCYVCDEGLHYFNGSCVSNNCSGIQPTGFNFTKGNNFTTIGATNWDYRMDLRSSSNGLGACQWYCNSGFKLNISDNKSCMVGNASCVSEIGGFCSSSGMNGSYSVEGSCDTGVCYMCNVSAGYNYNGSGCIYGLCTNGQTWNGLACVTPSSDISCNDGCALNNKCVRGSFRAEIDLQRVYCDGTTNEFVLQKENDATCIENYECKTNLCTQDGRCIDIAEEVIKASTILKKISCWISTGFKWDSSEWATCLASED